MILDIIILGIIIFIGFALIELTPAWGKKKKKAEKTDTVKSEKVDRDLTWEQWQNEK